MGEPKVSLFLSNVTKKEAKEAIEHLFGAVMWGKEVDETTLTPVVRSYPTSDAVATIMPMDRSKP